MRSLVADSYFFCTLCLCHVTAIIRRRLGEATYQGPVQSLYWYLSLSLSAAVVIFHFTSKVIRQPIYLLIMIKKLLSVLCKWSNQLLINTGTSFVAEWTWVSDTRIFNSFQYSMSWNGESVWLDISVFYFCTSGIEDIFISWFVIILALLGVGSLFVCCVIHCKQ